MRSVELEGRGASVTIGSEITVIPVEGARWRWERIENWYHRRSSEEEEGKHQRELADRELATIGELSFCSDLEDISASTRLIDREFKKQRNEVYTFLDLRITCNDTQ
ncbi:uncharacterized protein LOC120281252 [Dioscorea cayenensis subsp. rotundata]|uniref:Uncharacterized protein LOC120281252 n=1 Tax=Dioscorea cayennensis subsp. rotundata TaxID=55577 RepID=A0AB40CVG0_DIOCR|nr:uncharacterized protein LOC120281252 [Dioscorea cayenensis subsp. rotundata]